MWRSSLFAYTLKSHSLTVQKVHTVQKEKEDWKDTRFYLSYAFDCNEHNDLKPGIDLTQQVPVKYWPLEQRSAVRYFDKPRWTGIFVMLWHIVCEL